MTCARASELLAAYADGGLEGQEHDQVAAHVRGCPACTDEVRALRELFSDARRLQAPPQRDEAFWSDLTRDVRVAVAAQRPVSSFWRLPAVTAFFALAAAALVWIVIKQPAPPARPPETVAATAPTPVATPQTKPLPKAAELPGFQDLEDLDSDQLAAVAAALAPDEESSPSEDELAVASPAVAEAYLENLDDADLARIGAAL